MCSGRDQRQARQRRGQGAGYAGFHSGDSFAERSVSYSENGICGPIAQTARACIEDARFNEPASARFVGLDDLTLKNAEARCIHWLLRQCPIPYESALFEMELEPPNVLWQPS